MQHVLLAPDKFKGTLSADEAAAALARGFAAFPSTVLPVADGGEGTLNVLVGAARRRGERVELRSQRVSGPLGSPVEATFAFLPTSGRAILESARTSGLGLSPNRDALRATTRGLGELALAAIDAGARELWIALGGSATTDGGTGFARVLGARFLDEDKIELPEGGGALERLDTVDLSGVNLRGASLVALVDVLNPLLGPRGTARVFAPQKGADPGEVKTLERGLARLAYLTNPALSTRAGSGAAGGLGFGLAAFMKAELVPGAQSIATDLGLENALAGAALAVTGEGKLDHTTLEGKAVRHVLSRARTLGVRSAVVAGTAERDTVQRLRDMGVWRIVTLEELASGDLDLARRDAARLCEEAARTLARELVADGASASTVAGESGPA